MAEDLFAEETEEKTKAKVAKETPETPEVSKDIEEGFLAERDPASSMADPFAVDKADPIDVIGNSLDQQISSVARATGKKLNAMPKDNIVVPIDKLNKNDQYVELGINGYNFRVQRGVKVALPRAVVDLLITAGYSPTLVR
ncbi:MAG: hypothetical protein GX963_15930 [Bacteroidales bacterium]|jgi:hypothetical protein|nr:hypothetical protein [Bacteroidales bacterium]